jgi:hypothetical protein
MSSGELSIRSLTLESLPQEVLLCILTFLPFPALKNLQSTSHFFQALPSPTLLSSAQKSYSSSLFAHEQDMAKLLAQNETSTKFGEKPSMRNIHEIDDMLVCYCCFREQLKGRFANTQVTKKRAFGHRDGCRRFCKECGVKRGFWAKGTVLRGFWWEELRVVCVRCGELRETDTTALQKSMCKMCHFVEPDQAEALRRHEKEKHALIGVGQQEEKGMLKRMGRCQRCWAIDHTIKPFVVRGESGELLCERCAG